MFWKFATKSVHVFCNYTTIVKPWGKRLQTHGLLAKEKQRDRQWDWKKTSAEVKTFDYQTGYSSTILAQNIAGFVNT